MEIFRVGDAVRLKGEALIIGYDPHIEYFLMEYPKDSLQVSRTFYWPAYVEPFNVQVHMEYQLPAFAQKYDSNSDLLYDFKRDGIYYMYEYDETEFRQNGKYRGVPIYGDGPIIDFTAEKTPHILQKGHNYHGEIYDGTHIHGIVSSIYYPNWEEPSVTIVAEATSESLSASMRLIIDSKAYAFVKCKYFTKK